MDKIKLVCINNKDYDWLIIGDLYEVYEYRTSDIYIIVSYKGGKKLAYNEYFITLSKYREKRIDEILND